MVWGFKNRPGSDLNTSACTLLPELHHTDSVLTKRGGRRQGNRDGLDLGVSSGDGEKWMNSGFPSSNYLLHSQLYLMCISFIGSLSAIRWGS